MLLTPRHRLHKLGRYRQIITRLIFYGFTELNEALGLTRRRVLTSRVSEIRRGLRIRRLPFGARLRMLFEEGDGSAVRVGDTHRDALWRKPRF